MPNYGFKCSVCGGIQEAYREFGSNYAPRCCNAPMEQIYSIPFGTRTVVEGEADV
jgi:hypothetical protein